MRAKSFCMTILMLAVVAVAPAAQAAGDGAKATLLLARVEVLSQQLAGMSNDAAGGNYDTFKSLKATRESIAERISRLDGYADKVAPKASFIELDAAWAQVSADAGSVLDSQMQVTAATTAGADFSARLPVLNARFDEVLKILVERPDSSAQVMIASRQMLLVDRMQRRIQTILAGGEEAQSATDGLRRDAELFRVVLAGLIDGNGDLDLKPIGEKNARGILKDIDAQWKELAPALDKLLSAATQIQEVRQQALKIADGVQTFLSKSDALMSRINE